MKIPELKDPTFLSDLSKYGVYVFEDKNKYLQWLNQSSIALGGVSPISLFDTEEGLELVLRELVAIEYGNFA